MAWSVKEGDYLVIYNYFRCTNMLSYTTSFSICYVCVSYCVKKRSLTMVNMSHYSNYWRSWLKVFFIIFIVKVAFYNLNFINFFNHFKNYIHLFSNDKCCFKIYFLVQVCHYTACNQFCYKSIYRYFQHFSQIFDYN